ncbi:acyltransferase [Bergeyella zoohelcum]|uniref:acyltransferase n=1 Tax=Bergeyella zoohelcum TaxID=1015 RepID=UPI002A91A564|nr:acyltransferase [Bergeyella zoohelcum]MDY6024641.1 acyltransferase [Bergeyella zoohelcum]
MAKVTIGEKLELRNHCSIRVGKDATLSIGNNVFMNNGCSVNCLEKIEIGENTLFGEGVKLYDHNHEYSSEKVERKKFKKAPIKIGKNCWLGSNVVVLKGVTIGDNSTIGANVTVYKDIPAHSMIINRQELIVKSSI